ncbi:hypothetical protein BJV82DRAFT_579055 [Fennellomyces sp. T-0311]|nr:hypothetical protein BJV82DRAFT_579055 [Fennellomyces sp. T-0311]
MANIPPDQAIAPIFEGFPDATRTVTRNCALKALTRPEYNFIQKESQHFSPRIKTSWTPSRSIKTVGNVPNTPAPNVLLQQNGQFMNVHNLNRITGNPATQQIIWEEIFDLNHVQPHRWRLGDNLNEVVNLNAITFGFSLQSDGVMAHLNFEKPRLLQIDPALTGEHESRRMGKGGLPPRQSTARVRRTMTCKFSSRWFGSWCFGYDHRRIDTKRSTTTRSLVGRDGIPNSGLPDRSARTQVFWQYKKELKNREKYGIQDEYDQIEGNSANVSTAVDYERHIRIISQIRNSVQHQLKNQLLGATPPIRQNPYALHTSYDKKTKKKMASKPPSSGNCVFGVGEE